MNNKYDLTEYVDKLYSAAVRKTGDSHIAEDITQETFLAAIQGLRRGVQPQHLYAWLLSIMSNKYCDWLREKYSKPQLSFENYPIEIPVDDQTDNSMEMLEAVRHELGYLAKIHRDVMVRFYIHGQTIEQIATDLSIPVGTVKSRLNTGRLHVREGVKQMESYTKQSFEPDILTISCSGSPGLNNEPFSLVSKEDKLTQNVLILSYKKPVTETEIAKSLGVPVAYIEPVVEKMVEGELMQRTDGGKVYTDFIIYTEKDRKATISEQLETASEHFDLFWGETEKALKELRKKDYFKKQTEPSKAKLELHFAIDLLTDGCVEVRNEVTGIMPYADYPYHKTGGRWIAIGNLYPPEYQYKKDMDFWRYSISGEAGTRIRNFHDTKYIELRQYDTALGRFPNRYFKEEYVKWFYELMTNVPREESSVGDHVLQGAEDLIESGILLKDHAVALNIPILSHSEYHDEKCLSSAHQEQLSQDIRDVYITLFEDGFVKLPSHLKSVPKWQQYMFCGDSVPMAVIHKAIENGLILKDVDYPVPATVFVIDR